MELRQKAEEQRAALAKAERDLRRAEVQVRGARLNRVADNIAQERARRGKKPLSREDLIARASRLIEDSDALKARLGEGGR